MKDLINSLLLLPLPIVYMIVAALGAGGGALIGKFLGKILKAPKVALIVAILGGGLALQAARIEIPELRRAAMVDVAWEDLSKNRLFAALIKHHLDAAIRLRDEMETLSSDLDSPESISKFQSFTQALLVEYLFKDLPHASNESIHRLMVHENSVMKRLQNRPDLCVAYSIGKIRFPLDPFLVPIWEETLPKEIAIKADIIETAFAEPGKTANLMSPDELFAAIESAYRLYGNDPKDFELLANVETLPPEQLCPLAIKFSDALLSLEPARAAEIYKAMAYFSTPPE